MSNKTVTTVNISKDIQERFKNDPMNPSTFLEHFGRAYLNGEITLKIVETIKKKEK